MKKILVVLLVVALALIGANAAMAQVAGTKHNISTLDGGTTTETCVFCHTPHQVAAANAQDPLWNKALSTNAVYGVYASATINATITELGAGTLGTATTSHLCMSCHDGTLAINAPLNAPNVGTIGAAIKITSFANLGTTLTDDHPVNFVYSDTLATTDGGLATLAVVKASALKLDALDKMQCATCHNVHNNLNVPFLRMSNLTSGMCTLCHTNK